MQKVDQKEIVVAIRAPMPPDVERGIRTLLKLAARYLAEEEGNDGGP